MWYVRVNFAEHADYFFKLSHEVGIRLQTSRRINHQNICAGGLGLL